VLAFSINPVLCYATVSPSCVKGGGQKTPFCVSTGVYIFHFFPKSTKLMTPSCSAHKSSLDMCNLRCQTPKNTRDSPEGSKRAQIDGIENNFTAKPRSCTHQIASFSAPFSSWALLKHALDASQHRLSYCKSAPGNSNIHQSGTLRDARSPLPDRLCARYISIGFNASSMGVAPIDSAHDFTSD